MPWTPLLREAALGLRPPGAEWAALAVDCSAVSGLGAGMPGLCAPRFETPSFRTLELRSLVRARFEFSRFFC